MCKQWIQSGADSKQKHHNHKMKTRYGMIVTKKRLNIEHGFISIGGRENHDKETIQQYRCRSGSSDLEVGWMSKTSIVARDVIG